MNIQEACKLMMDEGKKVKRADLRPEWAGWLKADSEGWLHAYRSDGGRDDINVYDILSENWEVVE